MANLIVFIIWGGIWYGLFRLMRKQGASKRKSHWASAIAGFFAAAITISVVQPAPTAPPIATPPNQPIPAATLAASQPIAPEPAPAKKDTAAAIDCNLDLECLGEKGSNKAHVYCQEPIEKLSKNAFQWTDKGLFERKFSKYKWGNKDLGIVTYIGDKVQFQNGFGAWVNIIYECDLILTDKAPVIVSVRALEGRL